MKIILSRKGYDSENGGGPSPILPDGRLVSLPIPSSRDQRRYHDLRGEDGERIVDTLRDLDAFPGGIDAHCHLDPDLSAWSVARQAGWRPTFGQVNAAAGHLDKQGVSAGDVFLFFGWFRHTEIVAGKLRFIRGPYQDLHVIFGWLQIADIIRPANGVPTWLEDHPHCSAHHRENPSNRIYVGSDRLLVAPPHAGAGVFRYSDRLVLTRPGMKRTRWSLSREIFEDVEISYHSAASWMADYFQSASKGQEFVFEANGAVVSWLRGLFG